MDLDGAEPPNLAHHHAPDRRTATTPARTDVEAEEVPAESWLTARLNLFERCLGPSRPSLNSGNLTLPLLVFVEASNFR